MQPDLEDLAQRFRRFASRAETSPLYRHLALAIAEDRTVLRIALEAASVPATLLLFAAVQSLLLECADHPLGRFYPNLTRDHRPAEEAFPDFRAFCQARQDEIVRILHTRRIQTNEVRRCSYLALGFSIVAKHASRFAVVDVGCGAGLHLLWRHFGYRYEDMRLGDKGSPVQLHCDLLGRFRPLLPNAWPQPQPLEHIGIDLMPLNALDPADENWLRALVSPEHFERAKLFCKALALAKFHPPKFWPEMHSIFYPMFWRRWILGWVSAFVTIT